MEFLKFFIIILLAMNLLDFFNRFHIFSEDCFKDNKNKIIDSKNFTYIKNDLKRFIELSLNEQKFLFGLIKLFKPKKIVEIGVSAGGSAYIILNAIKDMDNAKLFSIDKLTRWYRNNSKKVGWLIEENFPELKNKWSLYTGRNTAEYIESIGNNIDFVFIDTVHVTPGEMLNWLEILPFLKQEAIVVFHDTYLMFTKKFMNKTIVKNFSNNQLLCYIRGELILPLYNPAIINKNIGAIKLSKYQKRYYKQYFMALLNHWEYIPKENDLIILRKFFTKYYGENLVEIFNDAVEKNKLRMKIKLQKNNNKL